MHSKEKLAKPVRISLDKTNFTAIAVARLHRNNDHTGPGVYKVHHSKSKNGEAPEKKFMEANNTRNECK